MTVLAFARRGAARLAARAQEAGHPPVAPPGGARPGRRARLRARHRGGHRRGGRCVAAHVLQLLPVQGSRAVRRGPGPGTALRERLVREAPGEPALDALRMVMASEALAVADELTELGGDPADWLRRMKEARPTRTCARPTRRRWRWLNEPSLRASPSGSASTRSGIPIRGCWPPPPACLAPALRSGPVPAARAPLDQLVDLAFRALADGLPERCALRQVTEKKDNH